MRVGCGGFLCSCKFSNAGLVRLEQSSCITPPRPNYGTTNQPEVFRPKFFRGCARGMSVLKCLFFLFFHDLEGQTDVFGRTSAGISDTKLPLWADFSFLTSASWAHTQGYCKRGSGGQRKLEKIGATLN